MTTQKEDEFTIPVADDTAKSQPTLTREHTRKE